MIKKARIKKGDKVLVLIGKDRGRTGVVKKVFRKRGLALVEGVNIIKKHIKPQKGEKGGIIEIEKPILMCKLMVLCPYCNKPTKIGVTIDKKGEKYRICRKCKALL